MKPMTREEMQSRARELINRKDNVELRELLYRIHMDNFENMTVLQIEGEDVREMSSIEGFNTGMEVGKYSGLFELLTGMTVNELEETEEDIMSDLMNLVKEAGGLDGGSVSGKEKLLHAALSGAEGVIIDLYDLISEIVSLTTNVKTPEEKKMFSTIWNILNKRDMMVPAVVIESIKKRRTTKTKMNIEYGEKVMSEMGLSGYGSDISKLLGFQPDDVMTLSEEYMKEHIKKLFPDLYEKILANGGKIPHLFIIKNPKLDE